MIPYYALIGIPFIFAIYYELIYEKGTRIRPKKNYTVAIFFYIYIALLALRHETIGADVKRYIDIFHLIETNTIKDAFTMFSGNEVGYILLNKFTATFFHSEQLLLFFIAILCVGPIALLYYKESKNCLVSIALFLVMPIFQMNFSGLRQAISIAFVVPALYFIKEKLPIKFIVTVLIAMCFHRSAAILLIMYPIYYLNIKLKNVALLVPVGIVVLQFNNQIYLLLTGLMGEKFEERYAYVTETGAYTMLIVYILFTVYSFILMDETKMDECAKGFRNYLVVATFLQMFAPVNSIAMRLNYYFIVFIPIVITQISYYSKIKDKRIVLLIDVAIFILFTVYYVDKANSVDSLNIYPYQFFFQE